MARSGDFQAMLIRVLSSRNPKALDHFQIDIIEIPSSHPQSRSWERRRLNPMSWQVQTPTRKSPGGVLRIIQIAIPRRFRCQGSWGITNSQHDMLYPPTALNRLQSNYRERHYLMIHLLPMPRVLFTTPVT